MRQVDAIPLRPAQFDLLDERLRCRLLVRDGQQDCPFQREVGAVRIGCGGLLEYITSVVRTIQAKQ